MADRKGVKRIKPQRLEPKPDESRLLAPATTADIIRKYNIHSEMDVVPLVAEIKKAQRDLTASIVRAEMLKMAGKRLKAVRDESYDEQTFRADLNEFIGLALKGELLPSYVVRKVGTIFVNPEFNPKYVKPHRYQHSDGYPEERHICICGEEETASIHSKQGRMPDEVTRNTATKEMKDEHK